MGGSDKGEQMHPPSSIEAWSPTPPNIISRPGKTQTIPPKSLGVSKYSGLRSARRRFLLPPDKIIIMKK